MKKVKINAFRYYKKWRKFEDKHLVKSISEHISEPATKRLGVNIDDLLLAEISLLNRLGWQIKLTETAKKKWLGL